MKVMISMPMAGKHDETVRKEYNDIEGWVYCPYCGRELEPDMDMN